MSFAWGNDDRAQDRLGRDINFSGATPECDDVLVCVRVVIVDIRTANKVEGGEEGITTDPGEYKAEGRAWRRNGSYVNKQLG
jgi:hypothetical protein